MKGISTLEEKPHKAFLADRLQGFTNTLSSFWGFFIYQVLQMHDRVPCQIFTLCMGGSARKPQLNHYTVLFK